MLSRLVPFIAVLMTGLVTSAHAAGNVAVSIKPLHSLVAMVMEGIDTPELILPGSPHGGHMKPSQMRKISRADKIFIIDESLENVLAKPLIDHPGVVHMADIPGLTVYDVRLILETDHHDDHEGHDDHDHEGHDDHDHEGHDDHDHEGHDDHAHKDDDHDHEGHDHDESHHDEHGHHHADGRDLHLWLDPQNAIMMVGQIRDELKKVYPEHGSRLDANAEQAIASLRTLDAEIEVDLEQSKNRQFIVFHDAYQYLEKRYGLNLMISILDHHNAPVSATRLNRLQESLERQAVDCIFAEPQFDPKMASMLSQMSGANLAVIDPIGADIAEGRDHYTNLIKGIASSIRNCSG